MRTLLPALALVLSLGPGCSGLGSLGRAHDQPLRISQVSDDGDPARRASLRLVSEGLEADSARQRGRALSLYDRAVQVDPTNPYAYLAIARHHLEGTDPDRALPYLDQAEALFEAQNERSPGVDAHLLGLRGDAYYSRGDIHRGLDLLERARQAAPQVWSDGHLSAEELL